jgi:predicted dehydrogenase
MQSRRNFIGKVATGLAGTFAASNVMGANERIRIGIIGPGDRGQEILLQAVSLDNVECIGAADVYTRRLEEAKNIAPNAKTYLDYRHLLDDKDIDAVLIATPQHLHCQHFTAALDAGKHVYQEKTMAFTVAHAKKMRAAYHRAGEKRVVQIGHQWTSTGQLPDAMSYLKPELMGKITMIHASMFRNTPHGKAQWSRPIHPDMTTENIIWKSFLG